MQGRKMSSMVKVRPKLVLDRGRVNSINFSQQDESSPMSIVKIKENKQNTKRGTKVEVVLLDKQRAKSSFKQGSFKVRSVLSLKQPQHQQSQSKRSLKEVPPPATQPPREQQMSLDQFLGRFLHQLIISPQVFHFSGDFTLSRALLARLTRIIIEEIGYNSSQLENIIQKMQFLIAGAEQEPGQEECSRDESQRDKALQSSTKTSILAISRQGEVSFTYEAAAKESDSKGIQPSPPLPAEKQGLPGSAESEAFIFSHLRELDDYILKQPNKILHEAVRRHKYLEEELFTYADMLSISRVGICTYTPEANICFLEATLDAEMREVNRELVQGKGPLEAKGRLLRDYVLRVRAGYAGVVGELMRVIDCKTDVARTFVSKVVKWEENYLTRKEYLGNLKRDYCQHLHAITSTLARLRQEGRASFLGEVEESVAAIHRIFLVGNSFY